MGTFKIYTTLERQFLGESINKEFEFTEESKTIPGLSTPPSVLLERVGRGLITPDDIKHTLLNHDDDENTYPLEEASDLSVSYEQMVRDREALRSRIDTLRAEKAKVANEKAMEEKRILDQHRKQKQAKELEFLLKKNSEDLTLDNT